MVAEVLPPPSPPLLLRVANCDPRTSFARDPRVFRIDLDEPREEPKRCIPNPNGLLSLASDTDAIHSPIASAQLWMAALVEPGVDGDGDVGDKDEEEEEEEEDGGAASDMYKVHPSIHRFASPPPLLLSPSLSLSPP